MSKVESHTTTEVSDQIELVDFFVKHDEPKKIEKVDKPKQNEPPRK